MQVGPGMALLERTTTHVAIMDPIVTTEISVGTGGITTSKLLMRAEGLQVATAPAAACVVAPHRLA